MKKRYENKHFYDPGRFRISLTFFEQVTTEDGSGGSIPLTAPILRTRGVQEPIREGSQNAIEAGASVLNQDCYFIIRNRPDFIPVKSQVVVANGATGYTIAAIIPLDIPVNYIKLLCKTLQ